MTYQPKQRVRIETLVGSDVLSEWTTKGTVLRPKACNLPLPDGYHVVRFDDGGALCVHESRLMADNAV